MKLPEDSNDENKCPKLGAVHCTQCNLSSHTSVLVNAVMSLTLLRCSPVVSVVDIRTLHEKLNEERKRAKKEREEYSV